MPVLVCVRVRACVRARVCACVYLRMCVRAVFIIVPPMYVCMYASVQLLYYIIVDMRHCVWIRVDGLSCQAVQYVRWICFASTLHNEVCVQCTVLADMLFCRVAVELLLLSSLCYMVDCAQVVR